MGQWRWKNRLHKAGASPPIFQPYVGSDRLVLCPQSCRCESHPPQSAAARDIAAEAGSPCPSVHSPCFSLAQRCANPRLATPRWQTSQTLESSRAHVRRLACGATTIDLPVVDHADFLSLSHHLPKRASRENSLVAIPLSITL